jgi:serine/threonine protein kinase/tetratricopeptide (TPR) repeat protein
MSERDIFIAALQKEDPAERQAYLDEACARQPELRQQVEDLLRLHEGAGSFLQKPAAEPVATGPFPGAGEHAPPPEARGTVIGPYKLIEQIGEGGMGTVWMAQQTEPIKRLVAVKLIKAGMDSRPVIARFEAERQALALMDHAHIARVLDAGTTGAARPYFVMDLVKGVPITRYCDEYRLTTRQRLELFIPVCQAIQHAHQKGVIHRDLKPNNVLVALYDGRPVPKVIDFGVAKAAGQQLTDKTLVTGFGTVVGTLEYMSPEQAEVNQLDIDTRSDIYSLGVLLYELLTGTTPLEHRRVKGAGLLEALRIIREEETPRPSTRLSTAEELPTIAANRGTEPKKLSALFRGELDWIVMKALEKDRNRRYETANGLADDVQRYLADEPVLACPPSAGYRLRKFVRRNRGPVVAAGVVLLCLVAGTVGTTAGLVWAVRERDKKAGALIAETNAREAEGQARDRAMAALRDMADEIVENQMARDTELTEQNKEFLRKIITHFEAFAAVTAADAESRAIRAEGLLRVGRMRFSLGEFKEAEAAETDALALYRQLVADFPSRIEFRRHLAVLQNNRCALFRATGRLADAEAACRDALAIRKELADKFPTVPDFRRDLALSYVNLGAVFHTGRRLKEAEPACAEALALYKQLFEEDPTQLRFQRELAMSHNSLGAVFQETGRPKEAKAAYEAALAIRKELADKFPKRPDLRHDLSRSHYNLGNLFQATRRLMEAETAYGDALALLKELAAEYPTRPEFRSDLSQTQLSLSTVYYVTGRLKETEAAFADALVGFRRLVGDYPNQPERWYRVANACGNLALFRLDQRDFKAAKAYLDEAAPHQEAALKANPQHPEYRQCYRSNLTSRIWLCGGLGDQAGAKQVAQQLRDLDWDPPDNAYAAARGLSYCIRIVETDKQTAKPDRDKQAASYGDEAVKMLRDAVALGYRDAARMEKDVFLDPLRGRDDFKKLLAELEAKQK